MSVQFSVAIPAYNSALYLVETLRSVLDQITPPVAVVVVDDGSTDGTHEVLAQFADRIDIVSIENSGPGVARKTAIEHCKTEWIALCDSDDVWQPDHLERKRCLIESDDTVSLCYSNFKSFGPGATGPEVNLDEAPAQWLVEHTRHQDGDYHYLRNAFQATLYFNVGYTTGMAFTRALYDRCGGIRPAYSRWLAEDAEFTRRLALAAGPNAVYDRQPTWKYRRHPQNYSTPSEFRNILAGVRILEEHMRLGDIPASLHAEVKARIVQRHVKAFMSAYWQKHDVDAIEVARKIPLSSAWPTLWTRMLHSRLRHLVAPNTSANPDATA